MSNILEQPLIVDSLSIKELKEIINNLPDCDELGNSYEVWIESDGVSSPVRQVWSLNKRKNGCDILLNSEKE